MQMNRCKRRGFRFINLKTDRIVKVTGVCSKNEAIKKLKNKGIDDIIFLRGKRK